jgi:hypothetical protein
VGFRFPKKYLVSLVHSTRFFQDYLIEYILNWGVQKRGFKAIFFAQFLDPSRKNGLSELFRG